MVVGQDGLVANVAKYLVEQPVIGINPTPEAFDGVLVPHRLEDGVRLLEPVAHHELEPMRRSMASVALDDGQTLCALNELYLGHRSHQSARYELSLGEESATHSSSGVIVTTGTGATGVGLLDPPPAPQPHQLPAPSEARLAFFVREAFPSQTTSTELSETLDRGERCARAGLAHGIGSHFRRRHRIGLPALRLGYVCDRAAR